jgi:hypothetical protein
LTNDTNGLAQSVGELLRGGTDGLASDLVGPAGVVAKARGDLAEIVVQRNLVRLTCVLSVFSFLDYANSAPTSVPR